MICQMYTEILKITIQTKKIKILIVFGGMIADMINNKNLNSTVTALFIRGRKRNIFIVFITHSYFKVLKDFRLNSKHFIDFMKIYKNCTAEPYSFLANDTNLTSYNLLRFRNKFLEINF